MSKQPDKEIFLVRHGQTDYNLKGIIQGRGINSELNEKGRAQAQAFFNHYQHEVFDHILVSALTRTHQTLEPFAKAGYLLNQHPELDEIDWGVHEGQGGDPKLAEEYQYLTSRWRDGYLEDRIAGGESPLDLQIRQRLFIDEILPNYGKRVLICSHGRAIRSMLCNMLNLPLSQMDDFPHTNCSLYKLHMVDGKFEIVMFNNTEHLKLS